MRRRSEDGLQTLLDVRVVGEAVLAQLAEEKLTVKVYLELAVVGGHQLGYQQGGVGAEHLVKEADGFREVVSGGAVRDAQASANVDHMVILAMTAEPAL